MYYSNSDVQLPELAKCLEALGFLAESALNEIRTNGSPSADVTELAGLILKENIQEIAEQMRIIGEKIEAERVTDRGLLASQFFILNSMSNETKQSILNQFGKQYLFELTEAEARQAIFSHKK